MSDTTISIEEAINNVKNILNEEIVDDFVIISSEQTSNYCEIRYSQFNHIYEICHSIDNDIINDYKFKLLEYFKGYQEYDEEFVEETPPLQNGNQSSTIKLYLLYNRVTPTLTVIKEGDIEVVPPILYKYRSWNDVYEKRIITEDELYFSSPKGDKFKDDLECNLPIHFDLVTDEYLKKSIRNAVRIKYKCITEEEFNKICNERFNYLKDKYADKEYQEKFRTDNKKMLEEVLGVICLTRYNNKKTLWKNFADKNKGFCVGFDTNYMRNNPEFGVFGEVSYYDKEDLPKILPIYPNDESRRASFLENVFSLQNRWGSQKEFRVTKLFPPPSRAVKMNVEAYKELIFGCSMSKAEKEAIKQLTKDKYPNIKFYNAKIVDNLVQIEPYISSVS